MRIWLQLHSLFTLCFTLLIPKMKYVKKCVNPLLCHSRRVEVFGHRGPAHGCRCRLQRKNRVAALHDITEGRFMESDSSGGCRESIILISWCIYRCSTQSCNKAVSSDWSNTWRHRPPENLQSVLPEVLQQCFFILDFGFQALIIKTACLHIV